MYINELKLKSIGPFLNEKIKFTSDDESFNTITIITGENGAGKSIILDSIRGLLAGRYSKEVLNRQIVNNDMDFELSMNFTLGSSQMILKSSYIGERGGLVTDGAKMINFHIAHNIDKNEFKSKWILDYWNSQISTDTFKLDAITKLNTSSYLKDGLYGIHNNLNVIKLITFFDYLAGSDDQNESRLGKHLFALIKNLINECLNFGSFSHISRITLQPIIDIRGQEFTLDSLSSGSLYLIQKLLSLVYKAYSAFDIYGGDATDITNISGVLLIDEIENHLHPKWQKRVLRIIRKYFPNLQIILTTHSPFIISSIDGVKVFVCEMGEESSIILDQTDFYKYKPIEEIIRTPLFRTDSFNEEISELLVQRKRAIEKQDEKMIKDIENKLLEKNPEYFRYFKIDEIQ